MALNQPINFSPDADFQVETPLLHSNPTFKELETEVDLDTKVLEPKCHFTIIFKENCEPNFI